MMRLMRKDSPLVAYIQIMYLTGSNAPHSIQLVDKASTKYNVLRTKVSTELTAGLACLIPEHFQWRFVQIPIPIPDQCLPTAAT